MRRSLLVLCLLIATVATIDAQRARARRIRARPTIQAVSNPISAARLPSGSSTLPEAIWSTAGVSGGIPTNRTQCGATISAYGTSGSPSSAATINTAISSCGANQYVLLGAGTFHLNTTVDFGGKNDVTLRGAGPDSTFLSFHNDSGCIYGGNVCVNGNINPDPPSNTANWTAGYSKGTTSITLDAAPTVGDVIHLDQLNDSATDNNAIHMCSTSGNCSVEDDSGIRRPSRTQIETVQVTAVSGSGPYTVTISPGLLAPNWRSGQTPGAWWMSGSSHGVGIEDLSVDEAHFPVGGSCGGSNPCPGNVCNITFGDTRDGWIKNIRSTYAQRCHVLLYGALRITIRDSYFFGLQGDGSQSYGIEVNISELNLVENNIWHHLQSAMPNGEASVGTVYGYNYHVDSYYCVLPSWMQGSMYDHTGGIMFLLNEGNEGTGITADIIHGPAFFVTAFRNRSQGYDPEGCSVGGKSTQTIPVHIYAKNRYFNIVGNVLGDSRRPHTNYEGYPAANSTAGPDAHKDVSIYMLGWSNDQVKDASMSNDTLVRSTLLRWGNWDTVTAGSKFDSSEVPSSDANYPNTVPANNNLPNSLYLSAKPSWFGSVTWPPIGPDVTGGNISNVGGTAYKNPAHRCFETVMSGTGTETTPLTFNANSCY